MKIKQLKRYFIGIVMIAFLALLAGEAFANKAITSLLSMNRDCNKATDGSQCEHANNYAVVSPYWQAELGGSYTFVAVSHSSLSGMASQIGVVINAITSAGTAYDEAETFTIAAGSTERVFIIPTNHSTINSTTVSSAKFLAGTANFTYGHLRIVPATSHPELAYSAGIPASNRGDGFRDTTMLTYWGSVIVEAQTTGFAMEFIGDMNDSQTQGGFLANTFASGVNLN